MKDNEMRSDNILQQKSKTFAVRIVKLYQYLAVEKRETILSKQLLRSGTSIGANIHEGIYGQSKRDFTAKLSIALKEAVETEYWLELLVETEYLTREQYASIQQDCGELARLLTAIVKTSRGN